MKYLTLIRHAKSDWSLGNQKDFDRKLNDRGLRDAPRMGFKLNQLSFNPEKIYCSPAKRTTETVELLLEQLPYPIDNVEFVESIYEASVKTLFELCTNLKNDLSDVAFVGHNPSTTFLAEYLSAEILENVPTCGVIRISFDTNDWALISKGSGKLEYFLYPKMLKA
jgi:phosphohistidine phosphatase